MPTRSILIDYFTHLGRGAITDVVVTAPWDQTNPGTVLATIRFASGDLGMYQAVCNGPAPWVVTVGTAAARYEMRPLEKLPIQPHGRRRAVEQPGASADINYKPGLHRQTQQTLAALRGRPNTLPKLAASTRSVQLVAAVYGFESLTGPL